jgi:hypothetical protein
MVLFVPAGSPLLRTPSRLTSAYTTPPGNGCPSVAVPLAVASAKAVPLTVESSRRGSRGWIILH